MLTYFHFGKKVSTSRRTCTITFSAPRSPWTLTCGMENRYVQHESSGPTSKTGGRALQGRNPAAAARAARSARRKMSVVLELLRGADLESTSRRYGVTAVTLSPVARGFADGLRGGAQDPAGGSGRRAGPPDEVGDRRTGDGERAAPATHPAHGGREAISQVEVEEMSRTRSASSGRSYGRTSGSQGVGPAAVDVLPAALPEGLSPAARSARPDDELQR